MRPVILTAAAAALGFFPMAFSGSAGAEVQRPLATKHSVQRIDELLRDAEESGREELTDSTIGASFDGVQAVMKQLNAFYGVRGM